MNSLTKSQIAEQERLLRKLRVAEFIDCPDCHGMMIVDKGVYDYVICDTCSGTGRIYFNRKNRTPLDWWYSLPTWKRANYLAMAAFASTLLFIMLVVKIMEWRNLL